MCTKPLYLFLCLLTAGIWSCTDREEAIKNTTGNAFAQPEVQVPRILETITVVHSDSGELYKEMLRKSLVVNHTTGVHNAYLKLITKARSENDTIAAYQYYQEADLYFTQHLNRLKKQRAGYLREAYHLVSIHYAYEAYSHIPDVYALFDKLNTQQHYAFYLTLKTAEAYYSLGNLDSSFALLQVLKAGIQPTDSDYYQRLSKVYLSLGSVSGTLLLGDQSLAYFDSAAKLALLAGDTDIYVGALINKASYYYNAKRDYKAVKKILSYIIDSAELIRIPSKLAGCYHTMAACLLAEKKPQEALAYSLKCHELSQDFESYHNKINSFFIVGYNYNQLGQFEKAKKYLQDGIRIAEQYNNIRLLGNGYSQLSVALFNLGSYKESAIFKEKQIQLNEEMFKNESSRKVAEMEARYRAAEKDKVIAQTRLKVEQQRRVLYIFITFLAMIILLFAFFLVRRKHKMTIMRMKASMEGEEKERSRLAKELHDGIVSQLSVIKTHFSAFSNTQNQEYSSIIAQLDQSINELRTTSHNLLPDILIKAGLEKSLEIYCSKIGKLTNIEMEFQVVGKLPTLSEEFQLNIYRIIQELINNIIKHAKAKSILIQFNIHQTSLNITIDDDGVNCHWEDSGKESGIGLQNLNQRIGLLNGIMEIERGKTTSVYLEFNMQKHTLKTT